MEKVAAWHFTDPACPWAYSARPALARLRWRFGAQLDWRLVVIGLSETSERYERLGFTPGRLAQGWATFERRFGMPFGTTVKPRLAPSSRACRAIVAAREQGPDLGYAALRALQLMQFTTDRLLDDDGDLRWALESVADLDAAAAVARIDDPGIVAIYEADKAQARSAHGTPTHVQDRHSDSDGPIRYTAPSVRFEHPDGREIEVGGFQPFEAYDTALANLAPTLERRPPPARARDAVLEFPIGLTTAEVASIMRPTDLDEIEIGRTREDLLQAAGEGELSCIPMGTDALWIPRGVVAAAADVVTAPARAA